MSSLHIFALPDLGDGGETSEKVTDFNPSVGAMCGDYAWGHVQG